MWMEQSLWQRNFSVVVAASMPSGNMGEPWRGQRGGVDMGRKLLVFSFQFSGKRNLAFGEALDGIEGGDEVEPGVGVAALVGVGGTIPEVHGELAQS